MKKFLALGLMSGTSMDGIDISLVETDGVSLKRMNYNFTHYYSKETNEGLEKMFSSDLLSNYKSLNFDYLNKSITDDHIDAVKLVKKKTSLMPDLLGFHGQTILHLPEKKISIQLGDGNVIANKTNINVVSDFRSKDIQNGGQGAPLAPIYHQAILKQIKSESPSCIINIGGVSNLTYYDDKNLIGFDTGPGNGLIDWYVRKKLNLAYDKNGIIASKGIPKKAIVEEVTKNNFFKLVPPKSIDKLIFKNLLEKLNIFSLSAEDAVATITEITIISIINSLNFLPRIIKSMIIVGGGQHNSFIISELRRRYRGKVFTGNEIGLPADFLEAELMAYLAARHINGLAITFPNTTGVKKPTCTGRLHQPF